MASISFGPKLRPCLYGTDRALFHGWFQVSEIVPPSNLRGGHSGGVVADVFGLIETEGGYMIKVRPNVIQFVDNGIFQEYDFTSVESGGE